MKILDIDYTTTLDFSSPVNDHYFLLRCVPVSRAGQTVIARNLTIMPEATLTTSKDIFGNISYQGRIDTLHKNFSFHSTATVMVDRKDGYRDLCYPLYKYNTPLTRASREMKDFLYSILKDKVAVRDFTLVARLLREEIHRRISYVPGVTNVNTTAEEAFLTGKGVCQDFSHIFCSLCRELGIPARYVAGTSKGEGSTHAWAEYFVPESGEITENGTVMQGHWYGVDCTRNKNVDDTYVILASGRDYLDCKVDGGIFRGAANQTMTVFVKTTEKEMRKEQEVRSGQFELSDDEIEKRKNKLKQKNQEQQM